MAWELAFDGVDDYLALDTPVAVGVGDFNERFIFRYTGDPNQILFGNSATTNNLFRINNNTTILIKLGSTSTNITLSSPLLVGNQTLRISRSGTTVDVTDDDGNSLAVATVTNGASFTITGFGNINAGNNIFNGGLQLAQHYSDAAGTVLVHSWDATASDRSGSTDQPVLFDTVGGNHAGGVNFPSFDASVWVDLGGGGLTNVIKNFQFNTDLLSRDNKSFQFNTDLLSRDNKSFQFNTDLLSAVNVIKNFQFVINLLSRNSKSFQFNTDLLSRNSKSFTLNTDLLNRVDKDFTINLNLNGRIEKNFQTLVDLLSRDVKSHVLNSDFLHIVNKFFTFNTSLLQGQSVKKSFSISVDLKERFNKSFSVELDLLEQVTGNHEIVATLLNKVTMDFIARFDLTSRFNADFTIKLDTLERINKSFNLVFVVESDTITKTPARYTVKVGRVITFTQNNETILII